MRLPIIVCILGWIGSVARCQLNFMGNPLTDNTEYTAEESHFSERNEPRKIGISNIQFASPEIHNIKNLEGISSTNKISKKITKVEQTTELSLKNDKIDNNRFSISDDENSKKIDSISKSTHQSQPEARQLESSNSFQSQKLASENLPIFVDRSSYEKSFEFSNSRNPSYKNSPIIQNSDDALNKFLQSRTPEESQMALQNYFQIREIGRSDEINRQQKNSDDYIIKNDAIRNQMNEKEFINYEETNPGSAMNYSPLITRPERWKKIGIQSRRDMPIVGPRVGPHYRGQISPIGNGRLRQGKPWYQSRIGPGSSSGYRTIFSGPPPPPPGALIGKRKPAPELIYTKPPGFNHGPSNDIIPYENAPWNSHDDTLPPQKNILWSQLYAQSYDPHYYNYIAKTGKIKPWLYGKLGEKKEKSIWWELFAGFKKHGMKNIMNPMFLLGMTIPTLTLMLTALVQKRSFARSATGGYLNEEIIEEYARILQDAIECNEKRVNDSNNNDKKCW